VWAGQRADVRVALASPAPKPVAAKPDGGGGEQFFERRGF
jgi:hypothetical protein